MADSDPQAMEQIKKRTFTTITTTANNLIKKVKSAGEEDKLPILLEGLEAATREYLSIMLEKLELTDIIAHSPKGRFLYALDLKTLFTSEAEKKELEQAKVRKSSATLVTLDY